MKRKSELNNKELLKACKEVVKSTLWQTQNPIDVSDIIDSDQINNTINTYYKNALFHVKFIENQKRDPHLITRAVYYLAHVHAIPPMKDNTIWFNEVLTALIELACSNTRHTAHSAEFLNDIEDEIKEIRSNIYDN